jgi:hypothetical protein
MAKKWDTTGMSRMELVRRIEAALNERLGYQVHLTITEKRIALDLLERAARWAGYFLYWDYQNSPCSVNSNAKEERERDFNEMGRAIVCGVYEMEHNEGANQ